MSKVRGSSLIAINDWISDQLKDEYPRFIARMRAPVAKVLTEAVVWDWYPSQYLAEVYESIVAKLRNGNGGEKVLDDLGRFLAKSDLEHTSRNDITVLPVPRMLVRLPKFWSRFRDCGEFELTSIDENKNYAEFTLTGCAGGKMQIQVTRAWIEQVVDYMCEAKVHVVGQLYPGKYDELYYWKVSW